MSAISKTILELRTKNGWTQEELSEKLLNSPKTISKWERGESQPDYDKLIELSKIFDASIDYLVTGKEEKTIILMSKLEWCAKNDDPEMLKQISITSTDEDGRSLFYYITRYTSARVFASVMEKIEKDDAIRKFGKSNYAKLALISKRGDLLDPFKAQEKNSAYGKKIEYTDFEEDIYTFILCDESVTESMLEEIVKLNEAYPEYYCLRLNRLIALCCKNKSYRFFKKLVSLAKHPDIRVSINKDTIRQALDNADFKVAEQLNAINSDAEKVSPYEFKVARVRANPKMTEEEKLVEYADHDGIINIDDLLKVNNFDIISRELKKPIHEIESWFSKIEASTLRDLFRLSIDNGYKNCALYIAQDRLPDFKTSIVKDVWKIVHPKYDEHRPPYVLCMNEKYLRLKDSQSIPTEKDSIEKIIEFINACKSQLLQEQKARLDLATYTEQFKEHDQKELERMDTIRKIYNKAENLLRRALNQSDAFLNDLVNKYETDCDARDLLKKLIAERNSLFHSDSNSDRLTDKEISECIALIQKIELEVTGHG